MNSYDEGKKNWKKRYKLKVKADVMPLWCKLRGHKWSMNWKSERRTCVRCGSKEEF